MHSICLLESVSRSDGGIFEAECALQCELFLGQGVQVDVVGMEDSFSVQDAARWIPLKPKVVKTSGPNFLGYSPDLLATLDPKADLLYAATLWKYPSWAALQWSERTGKPMMVAPHGSLDVWALKNSAWKKWLASKLFKNRQLHKALCIRALCQSEADAIRAYGLTNPIAIIPNGVELPGADQELGASSRELRLKNKASTPHTLLFLGRIHPKKGLPNLIRGFKKALDSRPLNLDAPWQLVIAGWDQGGHEAELIKLCEELGLSFQGRVARDEGRESAASVVFFGPAFGDDKKSLLRSADAFILPSLSEGLPMSILEAWSYELPVVMTPECNLPEGYAADAAIRIETSVESIAQGLNSLFLMGVFDLQSMGAKGRILVKERFTWQTLAVQMKEVYDWMLGGGTKPSSMSTRK